MPTKEISQAKLEANRRNARGESASGNKAGRKPKAITPEQREEIYERVRAGVPPEASAVAIGVKRSTLYEWLARGREEDAREPYRSFCEGVDKALAGWEMRDILLIGKAAETQWQAAAWRLERRLVQKYGKHTRVEGTLTVTARPFIDVAKLSIDEQRTLRDLLAKAQPEPEALPEDGRPALELMPGPPAVAAA